MDYHSLYQLLNRFSFVSESAFKALFDKLQNRHFEKGALMISPGQVQTELYFIKKGTQMSYFENSHKLHVMAFTYASDFCAIPDSFLLQQPSKYSMQSLTDTEVLALTYTDLQKLFDEYQEIERLFRKMTEMILAGVLDRQLELKAENMEQRFRTFCGRSPHLLQLVPQKYLASYLGIDPTNFSKLINSIRI